MSILPTITTSIVPKIYAWTKRAITEDLHNRFDLIETWTLPTINKAYWVIPDIESDTICFKDNTPYVKPYKNTAELTHCNGATLSPEKCIIVVTVGALIHDVCYDKIEIFAKAWNWSVKKVRKLFDQIFGAVLMALAYMIEPRIKRKLAICVARTYFTGVRLFGGIAHDAFKMLATLLLISNIVSVGIFASAMAAMTGCQVPEIWDYTQSITQPVYSNATSSVTSSVIFAAIN